VRSHRHQLSIRLLAIPWQEALCLWEQRERARAEILAAVDVAQASVSQGEGRVITQHSMHQLADEVKQRGRKRLTAERSSGRSRLTVLHRKPKRNSIASGITWPGKAAASRLPTGSLTPSRSAFICVRATHTLDVTELRNWLLVCVVFPWAGTS
jgi:hypothetical protein